MDRWIKTAWIMDRNLFVVMGIEVKVGMWRTLNAHYGSTSNIREVIKLYNLGDKTFETDFNSQNQVNR